MVSSDLVEQAIGYDKELENEFDEEDYELIDPDEEYEYEDWAALRSDELWKGYESLLEKSYDKFEVNKVSFSDFCYDEWIKIK